MYLQLCSRTLHCVRDSKPTIYYTHKNSCRRINRYLLSNLISNINAKILYCHVFCRRCNKRHRNVQINRYLLSNLISNINAKILYCHSRLYTWCILGEFENW